MGHRQKEQKRELLHELTHPTASINPILNLSLEQHPISRSRRTSGQGPFFCHSTDRFSLSLHCIRVIPTVLTLSTLWSIYCGKLPGTGFHVYQFEGGSEGQGVYRGGGIVSHPLPLPLSLSLSLYLSLLFIFFISSSSSSPHTHT